MNNLLQKSYDSFDGYRLAVDAIVRCLLLMGTMSLFEFSSLQAQSWIQTLAPKTSWTSIACSPDGSKLMAVVLNLNNESGGPVYTSTNSGLTWTPNGLSNLLGQCTATSSDGTKLVAGTYFSQIYSSTNSGSNWTAAGGANAWCSVTCSADGSVMAAIGEAPSTISISTNSGVNWNAANIPNKSWVSIACSADGRRLIVGPAYSSIYTSTDSGQSWMTNITPSAYWSCVASSADGCRLFALDSSGIFCYSTNFGTSWIVSSAPFQGGSSLCTSADGTVIVALAKGSIYSSRDLGSSWVNLNAPVNSESVALSADGSRLAAVAYGGGIWTYQASPVPTLSIIYTPNSFMLSWIVPSTNYMLQQSAGLIATNWTNVALSPALNLKTLRNELILSPPTGAGYYRLKSQ